MHKSNDGVFSLIPSRMLVVKNVFIGARFSETERINVNHAMGGSIDLAWGPFSVSKGTGSFWSCFEEDTFYGGPYVDDYWAWEWSSVESSAVACQKRCAKYAGEGCAFFSFKPDEGGTCYLSESGAKKTDSKGSVGGPRECSISGAKSSEQVLEMPGVQVIGFVSSLV